MSLSTIINTPLYDTAPVVNNPPGQLTVSEVNTTHNDTFYNTAYAPGTAIVISILVMDLPTAQLDQVGRIPPNFDTDPGVESVACCPYYKGIETLNQLLLVANHLYPPPAPPHFTDSFRNLTFRFLSPIWRKMVGTPLIVQLNV